MPAPNDRRAFLRAAGGLAAGLLAGGSAPATPSPRKRVLRLAHVTDIHVQPEFRAGDGMAACLRHLQAGADKPDLILSGGDHVMDCFKQTRDRAKLQWDLWARVLKAETSVPVRSCLGNHDIWGWDKAASKTTGEEPGHGKKWACDALGLATPYYSFDRAGWHFVALDGVQPGAKPGTFSAFLDPAQLDWLKRDLAAVPAATPVLVWTHVPVVSALPVLMYNRATPHASGIINPGNQHTDAAAVLELFGKHPNVKACLSGHLHRVDRVDLNGVSFHCNGAVSGAWWAGPNAGFPEGYAVVDLFDDGTHDCRYVPFGWKAGKS